MGFIYGISEIMMRETDALGAPAGGVAHEINNKLATIIGTVDVLIGQTDAKGEIGSGLADILDAAIQMRDLVRQLSRCQPA